MPWTSLSCCPWGPHTPAPSHPTVLRPPFPNCQESKVMAKMGEEMFFYPSVNPHIINIWSVSSGGQSSSSELVWGRCFLFFRPKCRDQYSVSVSLTAKHLLCGEGNAWEDWNQEPLGSWNLLDKHWFCSWQMFLAQVFKKVGCEAGLSLNAWMVQGGAMHWQKMGWRRRGSASPQRAWELMTNKGLNMSWWYS